MGNIIRHVVSCIIMSSLFFVSACATVPKEVVELSYTVGQDMEAVHVSYRALIQRHFATLRGQATTFLHDRWMPAYLREFIKSGNLIGLAQDPEPLQAFEGVSVWTEVAMDEIDNKKKQLLDPIDTDEKQLLSYVDESFTRMARANAMITAHLNSLRKVQEVQDEALQALKLKDVRDQVNSALIGASERAAQAIENIKKAEQTIKEVDKQKQKLLKKIKGE